MLQRRVVVLLVLLTLLLATLALVGTPADVWVTGHQTPEPSGVAGEFVVIAPASFGR